MRTERSGRDVELVDQTVDKVDGVGTGFLGLLEVGQESFSSERLGGVVRVVDDLPGGVVELSNRNAEVLVIALSTRDRTPEVANEEVRH